MENSVALVKPKLSPAEKKIIEMVLDALPTENSRCAYRRHLEAFFAWHASQDRPELNKALINQYVKSLRGQKLSSATINQKLSAIRKLASEAEDNNLIDSKIANGIRAVKGVPFRGRRTGNWLTKEEAQMWLNAPDVKTLKGVGDRAVLAVLIGGGRKRQYSLSLTSSSAKDAGQLWILWENATRCEPCQCLRGRKRRLTRGLMQRELIMALFFGE